MGLDDKILAALIMREGSEVAPPDRSGRISRFGVTAATLSDHRGHNVTDDEIRNLSVTEALDIYQTEFIHKPSYHLLGSEALRGVLADYAVNSGPHTATQALQRVLGVPEDGIVGAQTIHAANIHDGTRLGMQVLWERIGHVIRLAVADPTQLKFLTGWYNRVREQATELDS